jgi:hypothetical protein
MFDIVVVLSQNLGCRTVHIGHGLGQTHHARCNATAGRSRQIKMSAKPETERKSPIYLLNLGSDENIPA